MRKAFQALATAVHTLTVLPFPGGGGAASPAASFPFFPLVGLALGVVAAALGWALGARLGWAAGAAAAAVAALAGLSGGLHLDGLADTADGLAGGRTRERTLEIMKDSRIGTMGAVALGLVLLLKTVALMRLVGLREWAWIPLPVMLARLAMVQLAVFQPYARAGGGTAERHVKDARPWHYGAALALALLLGAALTGPGAWIAAAPAAGATAWIGRRMTRRLGGVTGDVLGWAGEIVETALFFLLAAAGPWLHRVDWHALAR